MNSEDLKKRTKVFGLNTIKVIQNIQKNRITDVICKQLLRAATSVGANYRAACLAKSYQDFIYKLRIAQEEADEAAYWFELLVESCVIKEDIVRDLLDEAKQLTAIFTASAKTAKGKKH